MPPEISALIGQVGTIVGPIGVLSIVLFAMWLKARRNGKSAAPSSSMADHDVLIRIDTKVDLITDTVTVVESDVKALIKDSHIHPIV